MTVEALNCPNCGAAVASDHTRCEFCKARLKTIGCPKCLGLMFIGSRFCGHCGAVAAPVEISLDGEAGECPRCRSELEPLEVEGIKFRACQKCDGLWVSVDAFETVCADQERQASVLVFLGDRTHRGPSMTKINYVPCPDCGQLMNRNNFAKASGVIVDICKQHGVWFDADELPSIIEFIQKGGMEIARQRDKNELVDERARLRRLAREKDRLEKRLGVWDRWEDRDVSAIQSFVRSLFR